MDVEIVYQQLTAMTWGLDHQRILNEIFTCMIHGSTWMNMHDLMDDDPLAMDFPMNHP